MAVADDPKSVSVKLREEGNKLYLSVTNDLALVLRKYRLEEALRKYNQALTNARNGDEKVSALKNIATASCKFANILSENGEKFSSIRYYFKSAIENFSASYNFGQSVKSADWQEKLMAAFVICMLDVEGACEDFPYPKKIGFLEECTYAVAVDSIRAENALKIAEICFHEALSALGDKDFKLSLARLNDCYRPTEEAAKAASRNEELLSDVNVMKEDVKFHTCTAESLQALAIGDNMYKDYCQVTKSGEFSNFLMAWEILDWYKKAVLLTRELEVEMEAIALSRIGRVYDKVLKMKSKAKENFKRSIELALTMLPRTFNNEDWYKECTEALERYQKEQVEQESEKWNTERKPFLEELKDELDLIKKEAAKSDLQLLKWVYKEHPPKNENHTLPEDLPDISSGRQTYGSELKNILRKAVIHYHPDRCDVEEHGKKWKVLSEEICKILTCRYESFKG